MVLHRGMFQVETEFVQSLRLHEGITHQVEGERKHGHWPWVDFSREGTLAKIFECSDLQQTDFAILTNHCEDRVIFAATGEHSCATILGRK